MIRRFTLCLLASPAVAAPLFEDHSVALGGHTYTGGWEQFVGGGRILLVKCQTLLRQSAQPGQLAFGRVADENPAHRGGDRLLLFTEHALRQLARSLDVSWVVQHR